MQRTLILIGFLLSSLSRICSYLIRKYEASKFCSKGSNVHIGRRTKFTGKNISLGSNVYIGDGCIFQSTHGTIKIGNDVMFGPGVHIHGGNHRFDVLGKPMYQLAKKDADVDPPIEIEDDVWVGAGTIILSGVSIGQGAVIGAGSVVTKSVARYAIAVGNPARTIKFRFTEEELSQFQTGESK